MKNYQREQVDRTENKIKMEEACLHSGGRAFSILPMRLCLVLLALIRYLCTYLPDEATEVPNFVLCENGAAVNCVRSAPFTFTFTFTSNQDCLGRVPTGPSDLTISLEI